MQKIYDPKPNTAPVLGALQNHWSYSTKTSFEFTPPHSPENLSTLHKFSPVLFSTDTFSPENNFSGSDLQDEIVKYFSKLEICQLSSLITKLTKMLEEKENCVANAEKPASLQGILGMPIKSLPNDRLSTAQTTSLEIHQETSKKCNMLLDFLQPIFNQCLGSLARSFSDNYFNKFASFANNSLTCHKIEETEATLIFQMHLLQAGMQHFTQNVDNHLTLTADLKTGVFKSIREHCERAQSGSVASYDRPLECPQIQKTEIGTNKKTQRGSTKRKASGPIFTFTPCKEGGPTVYPKFLREIDKFSKNVSLLPEHVPSFIPLPYLTETDVDTGKWKVMTLTPQTLFVKGSDVNKALGYENFRGRIYSKHTNLFHYAMTDEDKVDSRKESDIVMQICGAKPHICLLSDFQRLASVYNYYLPQKPVIENSFKLPVSVIERIQVNLNKHAASLEY